MTSEMDMFRDPRFKNRQPLADPPVEYDDAAQSSRAGAWFGFALLSAPSDAACCIALHCIRGALSALALLALLALASME
jgi:hypothetical protein